MTYKISYEEVTWVRWDETLKETVSSRILQFCITEMQNPHDTVKVCDTFAEAIKWLDDRDAVKDVVAINIDYWK